MSQQNQQQMPTLPPIRNYPIWKSDVVIPVTGLEWETLQESINQMIAAQQVVQSVVSRCIVDGVMQLEYEKLNPQTLTYEPMSDEEKAPYVKQVEDSIKLVKERREKQTDEATIETSDADSTEEPAEKKGKVVKFKSK